MPPLRSFLLLVLACSLLPAQPTHSQPYTITTLAGNAGYGTADAVGRNARFLNPAGVAFDGAGNLYVVDQANQTIRKITRDAVVSTLAGLPGSTGSADGTGSHARFYYPSGVAADSTGHLYVADTYNHTIRKITPSGVVTTLAGMAGVSGSTNGTGANARFNYPRGVAVDAAGNVYVADSINHRIRKITPSGVVTTLAGNTGGNGGNGYTTNSASFSSPHGIAVDTAGIIYVADTFNHAIRTITPDGLVGVLAGRIGYPGTADGPGSSARFSYPQTLTLDGAGNIYVADRANHTIRKITPAGVVITLAGLAGTTGSTDGTGSSARFNEPYGIAADPEGTVCVADYFNNAIRKLTPQGVTTTLAGLPGSIGSADGPYTEARFYAPRGITLDRAGNIYVFDAGNYTIRKLTPQGQVRTLAGLAGSKGSADGPAGDARFSFGSGIAVDSLGNVFVVDTDNHTIRKLTSAGGVSTLAGLAGTGGSADGQGSTARFYRPNGIGVDQADNLYVSDTDNHSIRLITPGGLVSTIAGVPRFSGTNDGPASTARFTQPHALAVSSAGDIYVADAGNHTIRLVTPNRLVSTVAGLAGKSGSTDGIGNAARFNYPTGLALDPAGNLYVADVGNDVIRKITPDRVVSTLAGLPGTRGSSDGTGSASRFYDPFGIAVDAAGNLYVTDYFNHTIRFGTIARPALRFSRAGNQLLLSWPLTANNWIIETSSTLSPAAPWTPLPTLPHSNGETLVLTNSVESGGRFFRLRSP